jgi:aminocarboxymuconate-semialdehyde decarboxylase
VPIDVHAHYVPPQLIDALDRRGKAIGVRLVRSGAGPPAVHFDYGFKVRPFFPRLTEPVAARRAGLDEQGIDQQIAGTWPDLFGYGLAADACIAWHRMLNDTGRHGAAGAAALGRIVGGRDRADCRCEPAPCLRASAVIDDG